MPLEKITSVQGTGIVVAGDDIDTDRIIPARYMKCVTFDGLGEYLFHDVRHDENGNKLEHPLNAPRAGNSKFLISGVNFGCGSSREHAPQAIYRFGFRAVIAAGFAEIFFGNSTTLGMPCVTLDRASLAEVQSSVAANPTLELSLDLVALTLKVGDKQYAVGLRESARDALINGRWDAIGELLDGVDAVRATAAGLPYLAA